MVETKTNSLLKQLFDIYSDLADFATVYTMEAHPAESEDFVNFVDINIHK
jgi:hypothetical protein